MRQKSGPESAEQVVKDIRRATRRHFSAEDKIRIVLEGLRGEDSIAERTSITGGRRSSSRPARSGWPGTPLAQPPRTRSRSCGARHRLSRAGGAIQPSLSLSRLRQVTTRFERQDVWHRCRLD
jgi:transposase-like protein